MFIFQQGKYRVKVKIFDMEGAEFVCAELRVTVPIQDYSDYPNDY